MSEPIELHPAYSADCPTCGREFFIRCVGYEASEEDMAELRDEFGIQPFETGAWYRRPNTVTCSHCAAEFTVTCEPGDQDHP
jgi:hypothetical protein